MKNIHSKISFRRQIQIESFPIGTRLAWRNENLSKADTELEAEDLYSPNIIRENLFELSNNLFDILN